MCKKPLFLAGVGGGLQKTLKLYSRIHFPQLLFHPLQQFPKREKLRIAEFWQMP
jgi:hypothetical protein